MYNKGRHSATPEVWSFQIHRSTCDETMDEFLRWLAASILELVLLTVTLCQQGFWRCSFYQPYWGLLCFVLYNCGRASSLYRAQPSTIEHFDINWVYFIQGSEHHDYIRVPYFLNSHLLLSRSRLWRAEEVVGTIRQDGWMLNWSDQLTCMCGEALSHGHPVGVSSYQVALAMLGISSCTQIRMKIKPK